MWLGQILLLKPSPEQCITVAKKWTLWSVETCIVTSFLGSSGGLRVSMVRWKEERPWEWSCTCWLIWRDGMWNVSLEYCKDVETRKLGSLSNKLCFSKWTELVAGCFYISGTALYASIVSFNQYFLHLAQNSVNKLLIITNIPGMLCVCFLILRQSYNHFILQKAFVPGRDHVNVVEKLSKKIVGTKSPWTVSHSYFVPSLL